MVGGNQADVGNAADIDEDGGAVAEQAALKQRRQRRALAACGEVAAAEIGDGVDAGAFGDERRVLQLDGVGRGAVRAVAHGLAVGANGGDVVRGEAGLCEEGGDGVGAGFGVLPGGDGGAMKFVVARLAQCLQRGAQGGRHGLFVVGEVVVVAAGFADERGVDAVQAGAGHDADVVAGRGHVRCCSSSRVRRICVALAWSG